MVPAGSPITSFAEVDREGIRVYGVDNTATIRSARKSLKNTTVMYSRALMKL
jgi:polar amino acid transport system substrate-binding protein